MMTADVSRQRCRRGLVVPASRMGGDRVDGGLS